MSTIARGSIALAAMLATVQARPSYLGCDKIETMWAIGATINGMSNPTIAELTNACVITGVPTKIVANTEYTISVGCTEFPGGGICGSLLNVNGGGAIATGLSDTCGNTDAATASATYTWTAPATGGTFTFDALCARQTKAYRAPAAVGDMDPEDPEAATDAPTPVTTPEEFDATACVQKECIAELVPCLGDAICAKELAAFQASDKPTRCDIVSELGFALYDCGLDKCNPDNQLGDGCCGDNVVYTGFASDVLCTEQRTASDSFRAPDNNIDPLSEPEKHTVTCLYNIASCRNSGYDILDNTQTNGVHYAKYRLDSTMNAQMEALLEPIAASAPLTAGLKFKVCGKATATKVNGRDGFKICGGQVVEEDADTPASCGTPDAAGVSSAMAIRVGMFAVVAAMATIFC